jgi:hypothetical protein
VEEAIYNLAKTEFSAKNDTNAKGVVLLGIVHLLWLLLRRHGIRGRRLLPGVHIDHRRGLVSAIRLVRRWLLINAPDRWNGGCDERRVCHNLNISHLEV